MADPEEGGGRRSTFGPVVLAGLVGATLAAVAGGKPWVSGRSGAFDTSADDNQAMVSTLSANGAGESPLALALALVVLACWGVVLVTRGRFRRAVAGLALVAALGMLAATVEGYWSLPAKLGGALQELSGTDTVSTSFTGWYAAALVAAVICVATTLAAVRLVPSWPEMGSKYDAPAGTRDPADASGAAAGGSGDVPAENIDIWKALDEGRDPTA
ncbi:Trp biosynthesis-associated membrane protein [Microbacterium sp. ARD31]|uniref:Trp biosynthesis-associated membrane protein n=1 Tax=Microbacterium sp. ARD31 TaxID=2962576 RepID=UPI0028810231|nr:Trp biosynthesis-associated membrane protein [Microbacterium sp. ARD31]MDT0186684.1 Trp biosynthesis-associated membrane protein [Microbacterium sp. ARD31]